MDPESYDFVTLAMDFDYLSQPEETVDIDHYQFDKDTAQFLCKLDLDVLMGRDRDFDTMEYAMFAAKNARADILYQPQLFPETQPTDDDSEATVITDNTSSNKQKDMEKFSEQGEATIPSPEDNAQELPTSTIEPELRKNREPPVIGETTMNLPTRSWMIL